MITDVYFIPPIPYPLPKFHLFYRDCVKTMETAENATNFIFLLSATIASEGNGKQFSGLSINHSNNVRNQSIMLAKLF